MVAITLAGAAPAHAGWSIPVGCPVHDLDGQKVGTVAGADADGLRVAHGFFREYLVPFRAVADFDGQALRLAVTKDAVRRGEWDALPDPIGNQREGPGA